MPPSKAVALHTAASAVPLYDMRLNPPYLVDYTSNTTGRHLAVTKRLVRFRFGFSDAGAIGSGATGTNCRGREHEVTLVWSLASGKKLLLADDEEVHFSVGSPTRTEFRLAWTMEGNHALDLIGHAAAATPLKSRPAGWRQFDLRLDGQSVFDMPRIYELGVTAAGGARAATVPLELSVYDPGRVPHDDRAPPGEEGEEEEEAWSRRARGHESRRSMDRAASVPAIAPEEEAPRRGAERSASDPSDLLSGPILIGFAQSLPSAGGAHAAAITDRDPTGAQWARRARGRRPPQLAPQPISAPSRDGVAGNVTQFYGPEPSGNAHRNPQQQLLQQVGAPPQANYEPRMAADAVPKFDINAPVPTRTEFVLASPAAKGLTNGSHHSAPPQFYYDQSLRQRQYHKWDEPREFDSPTAETSLPSPLTADTFPFGPDDFGTWPGTPPHELARTSGGSVSPCAVDEVPPAPDAVGDLRAALGGMSDLGGVRAGPEPGAGAAAVAVNPFEVRSASENERGRADALDMSGKSLSDMKAIREGGARRGRARGVMKMWSSEDPKVAGVKSRVPRWNTYQRSFQQQQQPTFVAC